MLTPKEIGGSLPVYGFDISCSALLEPGYASIGAVADQATIAVCFKPTAVNTAYPLCDPTNHYLLLVTRNGAVAEVRKNGVLLGSYVTTATSYAGVLSEALTALRGNGSWILFESACGGRRSAPVGYVLRTLRQGVRTVDVPGVPDMGAIRSLCDRGQECRNHGDRHFRLRGRHAGQPDRRREERRFLVSVQ